MNRLIASELFKLRTTRAFYVLAGGALAFTLVIVGLGAVFAPDDLVLSELMMIGFFAQLIVLVIGILCITNEFRHGTVTPTLLVSPNRGELVLAKIAASLLVGLALGLAACGAITGVVALAGGAILSGLYAVLGVGLGAIIRNQVGAIIAALVYVLLLEGLIGLIPGVDEVLPKYGLGGTSQGLRGTDGGDASPELLTQVPGGLLLTGYVVVFVIAGILVMRGRDVTA